MIRCLLANDDMRDAVRMIHVRFGMAADEGRNDREGQYGKYDLLHEQTSEKRVFHAPYNWFAACSCNACAETAEPLGGMSWIIIMRPVHG